MKLKVFPLMISKQFMADHPRKGEPTNFREKILRNCIGAVHPHMIFSPFKLNPNDFPDPKITTIRTNYVYWARVAEEVNSGRGVLSLRQWTGSPYNYKRDGSKPVEFLRLEKMGVQKLMFDRHLGLFIDDVDSDTPISTIAKNDGLNWDDFKSWFKKLDYDEPYVIIHFTDFRYG